MAVQRRLPHFFPQNTAAPLSYTYAKTFSRGEFRVPPRDSRVAHAQSLAQSVEEAIDESKGHTASPAKGVVLEFCSDAGFDLELERLEFRAAGIELRNSRVVDDVMYATVFIPEGKAETFLKRFNEYSTQNTPVSGKPKHKDLVESINSIRLATLQGFWTDQIPFPPDDIELWWEIWLREAGPDSADVGMDFRSRASASGILVGERETKFPERRVLLALATAEQLSAVHMLFDSLAEIRQAKIPVEEWLTLKPWDIFEIIDSARARIAPPPSSCPSICHLDTGVNRAHPLIEHALSPDHLLSVDPSWTPADLRGHGTEMAGLALYGCLSQFLQSTHHEQLQHRLESVKILPDVGQNPPDLYGEITTQAAARVEIADPAQTRRTFCLTVTADSRDEGFPSSWSATLDQLSSSALEPNGSRRLIIVSAGNVLPEERHEYPHRNYVSGVEDPSQSWNSLAVGACTHLTNIHQTQYPGWVSIASHGGLSPASRTSLIWDDKSWPIKPDLVMEGGNSAIDPATNRADSLDNLSLLTTRLSSTGSLLTTTGDTSAATALVSRYAAHIWAAYPNLWPESVRALLIHSARWTDRMVADFPHSERHKRLRCYGFGMPDLGRAIESASNAATMIIQEQLQPFAKEPSEAVKTKDMHLHSLPWPVEVLQQLGELELRMRVTLSYFIEPSPGRRGWKKKHRYQSHGLRFDVKRPLETESDFLKRISRATWDDDDEPVDHSADTRSWSLGIHLRCKGSLHSDVWTGTAAQLAACGRIAVFPVTGWWRERAHLGCWNRTARYALIVSLETDSEAVDVYSPIQQIVSAPVTIPVPIH